MSRTLLLIPLFALPAPGPSSRAGAQDRPAGYRQVLPRGRLAAIDEPDYVPASEAQLSPSSWVLGVVIDGEPRAYSLNLLNSHEVVNDTIGDTSYAAVW